jgi:spermidine/putrescine transport system substrate-binding protein
MAAAMTWNSSAVLLASEGIPVRFAQPKEGTLTWVCGLMVHKDAPNLDRAYQIIDSLLSVEAGKFMINDYGYGHSNARSFDAFDAETLVSLGLSKNPADILDKGHFMIPQTQEWETRMNETFEMIKAGF